MSTQIHTTDFLQAAAGSGANSSLSDTLPSVTHGVYNRSLLKRAYPYLMHQMFGQQYPLGMRKGQSMVFRRYEKLAQNTIPLTEGVTPTGTSLVKRDYVATIKQYGDYVIVSDFVDMTHVDPIIQQSVELLGEAMGESMDAVYREYLVVGTSAYYVDADGSNNATGRTTVEGSLCPDALDTVIQALKSEEAKPFKPMIPGGPGDNTWPVATSYWALIHPDAELDLYNNFDIAGATAKRNTNGTTGVFVPVEHYANTGAVMENEVGKYRNVRFVTSTNVKSWANSGQGGNKTVYACLVFGKDAYGIVPLQRGSGRVIIQRAGGNTDPLEQRNTVGWKAAGCAIILNDAWMYRIEHVIGALTPNA